MADQPFRYVAAKQMKIGETMREIGEDVPEALKWRNVGSWERTGHLKRVSTGEVAKPVPVPVARSAPMPVEEPDTSAMAEPETEADPDADVKHICPECDRTYTTDAGLKRHMGRAHG